MLKGIEANEDRLKEYVEKSVGIITAVNPHIGYEAAARVAKEAIATGQSVRELCVKNGVLSQEDLELILDPFEMTHPGIAGATLLKKIKEEGTSPLFVYNIEMLYMNRGRDVMSKFTVASNGALETTLRGAEVLSTPLLNKGVAFTQNEREELGLKGLLPPAVLTLEEQARRAYEQFSSQPDDLLKNVYLTALHDRNEVLFYRILTDHLREMLPIVYTPTVGVAIQRYSHEYRKPRGVYLSINDSSGIEEAFTNIGATAENIDLVVVTDGEGILGIGDWGVGGINIAIGKLAVYTAAVGIDPSRVLPVILDVGTNREELLNNPFYIGNRHPRITGEAYDEFIDTFVQAVNKQFPKALLHWEDFSSRNARKILDKYRHDVCTFNDDIQGTGAVSLAAVLSA